MHNMSCIERMILKNVLGTELPDVLQNGIDAVSVLLLHGCVKEAMDVSMDLANDTPAGMAYRDLDDHELNNILIWKLVNYRLHELFIDHEPQIKSFIAIHRKKEVYTNLALFCIESIVNGDEEFIGELYEAPGLNKEERMTIWSREVFSED